MADRPVVLLLKAEDDKYRKPFYERDLEVAFSDVLTFTRENVDALTEALQALDQYVGIIITSPRAASAIVDVVQSLTPDKAQSVLEKLQSMSIYSVGKSTSKPVVEIGLTCIGEDSGSAEVLSEFIEKSGNTTGRMLFLCGNKRMDTLPESFSRRNQPLDELVVYSTKEVDEITWLKTNVPTWVVFFSPSGVKAAQRMEAVPWKTIKKAAIGKSTATALAKAAEALSDATWEANAVAAKPTPEDLAEAVASYNP
ncbi:hypothetical protein AeMF1_003648 [Aphanomyces euteiches]|nr:hypothetical protein AeMF1_012569 [Aphanomyces euteiches]KAH9115302.1 hypothetical protein AeMF1_010627 [Aphanomyces euteiches]KAH9125799.1 hypothetical protein AeMF1_003648 [Aphanomyces euteiches]KAH9183986.1 hypothetical protein AeNC1_014035 [Aphanomyces euteiches]